ncbi:MAG: hypothetical protein QG577_850 [Thermodesulfobacteriota bacterium]|nr:hypothetical protein [Thermodesulfobacteriota bacterium]
MKLAKRLLALAFVVFVITLFMFNKDLKVSIGYFGLSGPIDIPFWIIVTACFSLGFLIVAIIDSVSQLKWIREQRNWAKIDKERTEQIDKVNTALRSLEDLNRQLKADLERKTSEIQDLKKQSAAADFSRIEAREKEAQLTAGPDKTP